MSARFLPFRGLCGLLLLGAGFAGCKTTDAHGPKNSNYMITSADCEFYKYGPAQAFGPDLALHRGDRVTLLQKQFGYSHVMMADGTSGYVATEDLAPAPILPPSRPIAALTRGGGSGRSATHRQSNVRPTADPLFDINDVPSPPLPTDPAKPSPSFHF